jgi:hypothetical protein
MLAAGWLMQDGNGRVSKREVKDACCPPPSPRLQDGNGCVSKREVKAACCGLFAERKNMAISLKVRCCRGPRGGVSHCMHGCERQPEGALLPGTPASQLRTRYPALQPHTAMTHEACTSTLPEALTEWPDLHTAMTHETWTSRRCTARLPSA